MLLRIRTVRTADVRWLYGQWLRKGRREQRLVDVEVYCCVGWDCDGLGLCLYAVSGYADGVGACV